MDVLYASWPIYLYLNPALAGYLLRPLLEYQESMEFNLPYAAMNLGLSELIRRFLVVYEFEQAIHTPLQRATTRNTTLVSKVRAMK